MVTALTYILVSVTLALLLPLLRRGKGHEESGDCTVYRYSRNFGRFFLLIIPIYAGMVAFVYSTDPRESPHGIRFFVFAAIWVAMGCVPVFFYLYATSYRVRVDRLGIEYGSLFRVRRVEFASVGALATVRGKGIDYWVLSPAQERLAKIGGSVQDFDSLQADIEHATRGSNVTLFKFDGLDSWQERVNDVNGRWRDSKGPKMFVDLNRRVKWELIAAAVLLGAGIFLIHFYLG
jgi:hypothetical protein